MAIMAENLTSEVLCKVAADDVKCRNEINVVTGGAPGGDSAHLLLPSNSNHGGNVVSSLDVADHLAQGKKKRRRKTKRKTPYNKMSSENRGKKDIRRCIGHKRLSRYKQPVAPYNSNRFLIEDHNDLKDSDVDLMAAANKITVDHVNTVQKSPQRGRVRDSSFTSVESDEDFFYSSPEDEEEFLTKEFSNTYKDLHVEALANLTKPELIQHILCLEEKMDTTQKKLEALHKAKSDCPNSNSSMSDKLSYFQDEISKLVIANKTLLHENEELRRQKKTSSVSSEDSESDSSSSTCSSSSSCSEMSDHEQTTTNTHVNGDINSEIDTNLMDTENVT